MAPAWQPEGMSRPTFPTCITRSWLACNKALKHSDSLLSWSDPAMTREAAPTSKPRRRRDPALADDEGAVLDRRSVRRPASPRACRGCSVWTGRCRTSVRVAVVRRARSSTSPVAAQTIPCTCQSPPSHVAATGSRPCREGIKVEVEGERSACKQGNTKRRVWRKIHIR